MEGLLAFFDVTVTQVCLGTAEGYGEACGRGVPVGGDVGDPADWIIFRRDSLFSYGTLIISVVTFFTRTGLL